jgi:GNAT superfamily N-acetyltransferase
MLAQAWLAHSIFGTHAGLLYVAAKVRREFLANYMKDRPMSAIITAERPDSADAIMLITELEELLAPQYPSESRHGLSVEQLIAQDVAFFVLRADGTPAACGGIKLFGAEYGELKRMYVRPQFRGSGFAKLIVDYLADYAQAQGVVVLRLETGIHQRAAIGLYERMGFQPIPPIGAYREDPLSRFYEKRLIEGRRAQASIRVAAER